MGGGGRRITLLCHFPPKSRVVPEVVAKADGPPDASWKAAVRARENDQLIHMLAGHIFFIFMDEEVQQETLGANYL